MVQRTLGSGSMIIERNAYKLKIKEINKKTKNRTAEGQNQRIIPNNKRKKEMHIKITNYSKLDQYNSKNTRDNPQN